MQRIQAYISLSLIILIILSLLYLPIFFTLKKKRHTPYKTSKLSTMRVVVFPNHLRHDFFRYAHHLYARSLQLKPATPRVG
ncbi:MAG: hypothetical protein FWG87_09920 [Defluviitaleaceae bacterium]|nr:hypothetical protein [Defluviitaleaceae bacterium]